MYYLKLLFNILLITLVQAKFTPYIKIASVVPDLLFVFCLYFCINQKDVIKSMIFSAISGAVMDCLSGRIFGIYVFIYLVCSVLLYVVKGLVYKSNILINYLFVFLISVLGKSLFYLMNISVLKDIGYLYSLWSTILPEAFFNTAIFVVVTFLFNRFYKRRAGEYKWLNKRRECLALYVFFLL